MKPCPRGESDCKYACVRGASVWHVYVHYDKQTKGIYKRELVARVGSITFHNTGFKSRLLRWRPITRGRECVSRVFSDVVFLKAC